MALTKISRSLLDTGVSDNSDATAITITSAEKVLLGTSTASSSTHARLVLGGGTENYIQFSSTNDVGALIGVTSAGNMPFYTFTGAVGSESFSERMRIDSSGNVLVGGTSAYGADTITLGTGGFQQIRNTGAACMELRRDSSFGPVINLEKDGTANGVIGAYTTSRMYMGSGDTGIVFYPDSDAIYPIDASTPAARDDVIDLGLIGTRFDNIYATNGTIQTSDQNEKNTITNSDLGLDFVKQLSPKSYKFNGKTRTHYGLIAQDVETVLSDINKSTTDFAGFIKGDISEEQDGSSYRYALRYHEFIAPLIKAIQELSAKVEELESKINE